VAVSVSLATEQPVFPRAIGSIFRDLGQRSRAAQQAAYPKEIASRPSRRLRSDRSARWSQKVCRWRGAGRCCLWQRQRIPRGLEALELSTPVGIQSTTTYGHRRSCLFLPNPRAKWAVRHGDCRRDKQHQPLSAKELALCLRPTDLRPVSWARRNTRQSAAGLPPCVCAWPIATTGRSEPHPEHGCDRVADDQPEPTNTGCRTCLRRSICAS